MPLLSPRLRRFAGAFSLLFPLAGVGVVRAEPKLPQSDWVESIRVLEPGGGRLAWSVQGDWIAYDQMDAKGFYNIHIMDPNGRFRKCLTCPLREFRKAHAYNPSWHPSGNYLVFQVQLLARRLKLSPAEMTTPDRALHSSIWIIDKTGKHFWQLVSSAQTTGVLLDPVFSHEGDHLAFSERVRSKKGRWGEWAVRVGQFRIKAGVPRLRKVKSFKPGDRHRFVTVSGFSPSDDAVLVAGNLDNGQSELGMDVYEMSLKDGSVRPLTRSRREWDEGAHFSPDGELVAWTSSRGVDLGKTSQQVRAPSARAQRRELWLMRADGGDPQRLTFFSHPAAPESLRGAVVSDFAWGPEGKRLAVHVVTDLAAGVERIYLIELKGRSGPSRQVTGARPQS